MGVLAQRILTAALLIPLVVGGVLYLSPFWLALLFSSVVLLGAREWAKLSGLSSPWGQTLYTLLMALGLWAAYALGPDDVLWLVVPASLCWLGIALFIYRNRARPAVTARFAPGFQLNLALIGFPVLIPAWAALVFLHDSGEMGPLLVLFLLILIWVADSGAFFSGRRWGRARLAPAVSPGKTWEGVAGALAGAGLCGLFLIFALPEQRNGVGLVVLCVATALLSVVGDLFESLIKRRAGVKDSGALLPGHGGVLDRIDSLTAAAPVFLSGLILLRWDG